jgi:uncharacterized protein YndB with AHSA1/START domain
MSNLFSHAVPEPSPEKTPTGTREATVIVPVDPERAFDGFTDSMHLWWPIGDFNVLDEQSHIGFEDGDLVEESPDGEQALLAAVELWNPGAELVLSATKAPAGPTGGAVLRVAFGFLGPKKTEVRLVFEGAGRADASALARIGDWQGVLDRYARFMGGSLPLSPFD